MAARFVMMCEFDSFFLNFSLFVSDRLSSLNVSALFFFVCNQHIPATITLPDETLDARSLSSCTFDVAQLELGSLGTSLDNSVNKT